MTEHLDAFVLHLAASGASRGTRTQYRSKLRQFLAWLPAEPPAEVMACYRDHLMRSGRHPSTVRVCFCALRSFHAYLASHGGPVLPDPTGIRMPRLRPPNRRTPTTTELERLREAAERMPAHTPGREFRRGRTRIVFAILLNCGLRRSELLGLDLSDFWMDAEERTWLRVRWAKGAQTRSLPVNADLAASLDDWLPVRRRWCAAHGCPGHQALLPVDRQRRLCDNGLRALWNELLELAGLTDSGLKPHGLRHAFATRASSVAGANLKTVSILLGHLHLTTTDRYVHSSTDEQVRVVAELAGKPPAPASTSRDTRHRGWTQDHARHARTPLHHSQRVRRAA